MRKLYSNFYITPLWIYSVPFLCSRRKSSLRIFKDKWVKIGKRLVKIVDAMVTGTFKCRFESFKSLKYELYHFSPADQYRYLCKQFRSRWDGSYRAVSSGSALFVILLFDFWLKPLFATLDVSKFRDGRVQIRSSWVEGLRLFEAADAIVTDIFEFRFKSIGFKHELKVIKWWKETDAYR